MALGATKDPSLVEAVSRAIGTQLRAAGVNLNLAPVLDVNDNPANPVIGARSFGSDPAAVATLGAAAVKGFLESGVAPVGKHFPGHGNTSVDSHLDLPVLRQPIERLERVELAPFRAAIAGGLPAIMTAHIVFNAIDPLNPATMSEGVLKGLLRGRMGFRGLIMTDCLEMDAVSRQPGTVRAAVLALRAGADLLLISHTQSLQEQALEGVAAAVKSGEVAESRLNEAVERVLSLKKALGAPNPLEPEDACMPALWALSREAHLRSITLVRGSVRAGRQDGEAADKLAETLVVSLAPLPRAPAGAAGGSAGTPAGHELAKSLTDLAGIPAREVRPDERLASLAGVPGRLIILTQNAWKDPEQLTLARRLLEAVPDAVVAAARDPYDVAALPQARTFLCAYSPRPEAMEALALVLSGREGAAGRLPVALE
jgi:beta-N-acetylhexosaminidase